MVAMADTALDAKGTVAGVTRVGRSYPTRHIGITWPSNAASSPGAPSATRMQPSRKGVRSEAVH